MSLLPYQQRVAAEAELVKGWMDRLEAFIVSAPFHSLAEIDQSLLREQFTHMSSYLNVLERRIARFEQENALKAPADAGQELQPEADAPAAEPGAPL